MRFARRMAEVCRRCKARIKWARTAAGKAIPLDAEPTMRGSVLLDEFANATFLAKDEPRPADRPVFMPHHATCPYATEFRR